MLEEIQLQQVLPQEIEKRSFEIITEELGNVELDRFRHRLSSGQSIRRRILII